MLAISHIGRGACFPARQEVDLEQKKKKKGENNLKPVT
jgi:hypothetical protein